MEEEKEVEEIKEEKPKKNIVKKVIKIAIIVLLLGLIVALIFLYRENREIQNFIDEKIFRKVVQEDQNMSMQYTIDGTTNVYAFGRNIGILSNNVLTVYNQYGKQEYSLTISVTTPVFYSSGKYLAVAEKDGNKIYLVADKNIVWQADTEGKIEKIVVNKNGYVAVAVSQVSYKNVVIAYNQSGKELCKTYLSTTYAADMDISNDNKNLVIAETNLSEIQLKSTIRVVALEMVQENSENAVIYKEDIAVDSLVTSIKYDSQNRIICMLNDRIIKIEKGVKEEIAKYTEDVLFADISLKNHVVEVVQNDNEIKVKTINIADRREREYIIKEIPKEIYTKGNTIIIHAGNDVYFIDETGFLNQKYVSKQEIKNIVVSDYIAGIIYRNKIEIINF